MNIKIKRDVSTGEYGDGMDHCIVEISSEYAARIVELAETVVRLEVTSIHDYDCSPQFFAIDYSDDESSIEWEGRTECECIVVSSDSFYWEGYFKHTDMQWSTDSCDISMLRECLKVEAAALEDLPPMMGTLTKEAEKVLKERLKG